MEREEHRNSRERRRRKEGEMERERETEGEGVFWKDKAANKLISMTQRSKTEPQRRQKSLHTCMYRKNLPPWQYTAPVQTF